MPQTAESPATSRPAYGNYILRTGQGITGELELLFGAHWYGALFAGKKPILDLGPGRCWFTKQNKEDIIAVDNAPDLVDHYRLEGINIHLGDAYHIPFPEKSFQGLFCCWLLEHLEDPGRALAEMHRVLRPGGYACVIVPTPRDMAAFYDDYTHIRPYTRASLTQLAEDTGFQKHRVQYLFWTRGIKYVLCVLGCCWASRYCRFSDSTMRRLGLVNRNNLMLEAWKDSGS